MKKTGILILSLLILSAFVAGVSAKEKALDIIHLNNGKTVTGVIIEIIPNKSIKLETIDGNIITYPSDEIKKKDRVEIKLKSRTIATALAVVGPFVPLGIPIIQGYGQIYNGQYLKAVAFLANGFIGASIFVGGAYSDDNTIVGIGAGMVLGGYILSIIDANLSAKKINDLSNQKINAMKLKNYRPKDVSTSLNYLPNQGLTAALNFGF